MYSHTLRISTKQHFYLYYAFGYFYDLILIFKNACHALYMDHLTCLRVCRYSLENVALSDLVARWGCVSAACCKGGKLCVLGAGSRHLGLGSGSLLMPYFLLLLDVFFHGGLRFGSRTEEPNGGKQREGPLTRSQEPRSPWQR